MLEDKILLLQSVLTGEKPRHLFLFGAGKIGHGVAKVLKRYEEKLQHPLVEAFVDSKKSGENILGLPVLSKAELEQQYNNKRDLVLITAADMSIADDLKAMGIGEYIICDEKFPDYCAQYDSKRAVEKKPWEKAVFWMLRNIVDDGGVRAMSSLDHAYPEVTGYFIPTMLEYGYKQEALRAARWLLNCQEEDGGFRGTTGTINEKREFAFDSGQILRGLLAVKDEPSFAEEVKPAISKTCAYLCSQMIDDGKGGYCQQYLKGGYIVEPIMLYTLPPLREAAIWLGRKDWQQHVEACLQYYVRHEDFLRPDTLTHFLAYQMEALIELGHPEMIDDTMAYLMQEEKRKGFVPGCGGANWTCTTGDAQIAKCCFLTGRYEFGEKVLLEMEKYQLATGGFWGSYGPEADYFPSIEISWAVKYFLDANRLHIQEWFNYHADHFETSIDKVHRAELKSVLQAVTCDGICIADIGCGKGRFLRAIHDKFSACNLTGVDISEKMLEELPEYVHGCQGSLEHIPLADNSFELTLCIEALEHSVNAPLAVKELARITKPGGTIIIIDKNITSWGRLETPDWECWLDKEEVRQELLQYCNIAEAKALNLLGDEKDDMFIIWQAVVK